MAPNNLQNLFLVVWKLGQMYHFQLDNWSSLKRFSYLTVYLTKEIYIWREFKDFPNCR